MKVTVYVLAALAVLASTASASQRPLATRHTAAPLLRLPRATQAGETSLWGHIHSLARRGGRWEMTFDPGLPLHGVTAEHAALDDTGSRDVPNDVYVLDEEHRLLMYVVRPDARATVLTRGPTQTSVRLSELAQLLADRNPRGRPLFGRPKSFGYWIRIGASYPSPVLSIDAQYQP